jgi:hypothetical protein
MKPKCGQSTASAYTYKETKSLIKTDGVGLIEKKSLRHVEEIG